MLNIEEGSTSSKEKKHDQKLSMNEITIIELDAKTQLSRMRFKILDLQEKGKKITNLDEKVEKDIFKENTYSYQLDVEKTNLGTYTILIRSKDGGGFPLNDETQKELITYIGEGFERIIKYADMKAEMNKYKARMG